MMKIDKKTNIIIIAINIAFVMLAVLLFGAEYDTNDDFVMASIASGFYGFVSPKIVFSNIIYGYLLVGLYHIAPMINWIIVIYYLMLVLVGTMLLQIVLLVKKRQALYYYACLMVIFYREIYCTINFTRIAAWVAAVSYIVLAFCLSKEERFRLSRCAFAGIGLFYSSMLRLEAFLEVSAFAFVAWVLQLVFKHYIRVMKLIVPYVILFSIILVTVFVDRMSYKSDKWEEYKQWNYERAMLLDYTVPDYFRYSEEYEQLGITYAQYASLKKWCFEDSDVYSTDFFSKVRNIGQEKKYTFQKLLRKVLDIIFSNSYLWLVFLIGFICVVMYRKRHMIVSFCMLSIVAFAEIAYLVIKGRYVKRALVGIGVGLALFLFVTALFGDEETETGKDKNIKQYIAMAGLVIALVISGKQYSFGNSFTQGNADVLDYIEQLSRDNIVVTEPFTSEYIMHAHGLLYAPRQNLMQNSIGLGGWYSQAPKMLEKQARLGIDNIYMSLLDENVVFLCCGAEEICNNYLTEKTGKEIDYTPIANFDDMSVVKYHYVERE